MKTRCGIVAGLVLALALALVGPWGLDVAEGATYLRDDSGTPSAQCAFIGTSGDPTYCSTTDPLPVSGGGNVATSTTDPSGWAQQWFASSSTVLTRTNFFVPAFVSDSLAYGFTRTESGLPGFDLWITKNRGATWTLSGAYAGAGIFRDISSVLRLPSGVWIVGANTPGGDTPTDWPLRLWTLSGTVVQPTLTGIGAGLGTFLANGLAQGGSTILASVARGVDSSHYLCRSVNAGSNWACAAVGGTTQSSTGQNLAKVGSGLTWLLATDGGVYQSTNDGANWTQRLVAAGTTRAAVTCLSDTVCLFTGQASGTIYRSVNGGTNWGVAYVATPGAPDFAGFVNYGSGVAAVLPSANNEKVWITRDYGASWVPVFTFAGNNRCGVPCATAVSGGSAIITQGTTTTSNRAIYSAALPQGGMFIVGPTGIPAQVDANGRLLTNPTWTVAGPVTQTPTTPAVPRLTTPVQYTTLQNSSTTGAANTAVAVTLAGVASVRHHIYSVAAYCSAGTSTLTITDGGVTKWNPPAGAVGTTLFSATWTTGLTFATNSAAVVTLGACGAGNTGTLIVQSDQSPG